MLVQLVRHSLSQKHFFFVCFEKSTEQDVLAAEFLRLLKIFIKLKVQISQLRFVLILTL